MALEMAFQPFRPVAESRLGQCRVWRPHARTSGLQMYANSNRFAAALTGAV